MMNNEITNVGTKAPMSTGKKLAIAGGVLGVLGLIGVCVAKCVSSKNVETEDEFEDFDDFCEVESSEE